MAGELLKGIRGAIAAARAKASGNAQPAPGAVVPRRGAQLEPINCTACNFRFEADVSHGDPGPLCCDVCARFTCPTCGHVFFRALPEHQGKPHSFFLEHRHAHGDH